MLAQVTYIHRFIMADLEDEFMPSFIAASTGFVAMSQRKLTTPDRCHEFWNSHNRCPADAPRRPTMTDRCKIGRSAGLVNSGLYW